jgi:hypothetical protein
LATPPEYGKAMFLGRMGREVDRVKALSPQAHFLGIAVGARENWALLQSRGLHRVRLVVSDWHAGLKEVLDARLTTALPAARP